MSRSGLTELDAVLALARRGSFRAAAQELGLSSSAFSQAVAALEARLGVRLFHRTTRSVAPTEAGREFLARVGPAMTQIHTAIEAVAEHRAALTGTLRINSSLGAARMLLQPLVLEYLRRHPAMTVDIVTEGRRVDIVEAGFDLGLRPSAWVPRDMIAVPVAAGMRLAVVGAPAYFAHRRPPRQPADLAAHACIRARMPDGLPTPWEFLIDGQSRPQEVAGGLLVDAPALMLDAALAGWGLAQLADWYVQAAVTEGRLLRVLDAWAAPVPELSLYYSERRHPSAGLRAFIALARELQPARR